MKNQLAGHGREREAGLGEVLKEKAGTEYEGWWLETQSAGEVGKNYCTAIKDMMRNEDLIPKARRNS